MTAVETATGVVGTSVGRKEDASLLRGRGTFFDNLQFFFNPDEVNPIFTLLPQEGPPSVTSGAVRFSSPIGFYRAMFTRKWRPLWNVSLTLDLPFRNNRLRGAVVQAEAARTRAEVQERDLLRVIRENVVSEVESLRKEAESIQLAQAALAAQQQTLDGAIARLAPDLDILKEVERVHIEIAARHGLRLAAELGIDPAITAQFDMQAVKAAMGVPDVETLTYREVQERREIIKQRLEEKRRRA